MCGGWRSTGSYCLAVVKAQPPTFVTQAMCGEMASSRSSSFHLQDTRRKLHYGSQTRPDGDTVLQCTALQCSTPTLMWR